jgi:exodeoxyribonuclease-3
MRKAAFSGLATGLPFLCMVFSLSESEGLLLRLNNKMRCFCHAVFALIAIAGFRETAYGKDEAPRSIRVLSFNILVDAQRGGVQQTAEVIKASKADLVGLQEVDKSAKELSSLTGLTFVKTRKGGILTKYPVVETSKAQLGVKLELAPGQFLWHYNVHLYHAPYQPYQLAEIPYGKDNPFIKTPAEAIAEAIRARGVELAQLLMDMSPAIRANEKIVITGDFNEPSHLDWTADVLDSKRIPISVNWPQSRALIDSGFSDAYRQIYPDPLSKPGYTWTPTPAKRDVMDRIDFVYHSGMSPVQALIVGESSKTSDLVVTPYPSDHRAVLIEFQYPQSPK